MGNVVPRFGSADLTNCDREPIHIPGSIQPDGVLIAFDPETLEIVQIAGSSMKPACSRLSCRPRPPWAAKTGASISRTLQLREEGHDCVIAQAGILHP